MRERSLDITHPEQLIQAFREAAVLRHRDDQAASTIPKVAAQAGDGFQRVEVAMRDGEAVLRTEDCELNLSLHRSPNLLPPECWCRSRCQTLNIVGAAGLPRLGRCVSG